jgi:hypothetical protein
VRAPGVKRPPTPQYAVGRLLGLTNAPRRRPQPSDIPIVLPLKRKERARGDPRARSSASPARGDQASHTGHEYPQLPPQVSYSVS